MGGEDDAAGRTDEVAGTDTIEAFRTQFTVRLESPIGDDPGLEAVGLKIHGHVIR